MNIEKGHTLCTSDLNVISPVKHKILGNEISCLGTGGKAAEA